MSQQDLARVRIIRKPKLCSFHNRPLRKREGFIGCAECFGDYEAWFTETTLYESED